MDRGVRFRIWAPTAKKVELVLKDAGNVTMERDPSGYFTLVTEAAATGSLYKYRVDGKGPFPDPVSRYQPEGPHGWSEVVDPASYPWTAAEQQRPGIQLPGQVIYELHVGTFTREGTFRAAEREFERLRELGITVLEIMPVNEFGGSFGWGYDGVLWYAPYHEYGRPDDLRHMIQAAHEAGLSVILDVVYNHFGPDGNYLREFSPYYFAKNASEWGDAPNLDGEHSLPVREFMVQNVAQWIRDFHFDGLRFDATQSLKDSGVHGELILTAMARHAREAAGERQIILVSECERQDNQQLRCIEDGGCGIDGMWNDDLHHSAIVRLTGKREAYYTDHLARAQEFVSAAKFGFLFQGQYYSWQKAPRGTPFLRTEPWRGVTFLENHDQVANTLLGRRVIDQTSARKYRAMAGYWLLSTGTPMFFMGQEYGTTRPFLYFCDQQGELGKAVRTGRTEFLRQFESIRSTPDLQNAVADPLQRATFEGCKQLDEDRQNPRAQQMESFFRDLLRLRREEPLIRTWKKGVLDGAVLSEDCFVLRYFAEESSEDSSDRLVVVNFGAFLELPHVPEPLLAPPAGFDWKLKWHSEKLEYGGTSAMAPNTATGWHIAEECTLLLEAVPVKSDTVRK